MSGKIATLIILIHSWCMWNSHQPYERISNELLDRMCCNGYSCSDSIFSACLSCIWCKSQHLLPLQLKTCPVVSFLLELKMPKLYVFSFVFLFDRLVAVAFPTCRASYQLSVASFPQNQAMLKWPISLADFGMGGIITKKCQKTEKKLKKPKKIIKNSTKSIFCVYFVYILYQKYIICV